MAVGAPIVYAEAVRRPRRSERAASILFPLGAALASFALIFPRWQQCVLLVFQQRDISRALAGGAWNWAGPELTGGGRLPGPLYYWLLSLAALVSPGWKGGWLLLALARSAASAGVILLLRKNSAGLAAIAFAFVGLHSSFPLQSSELLLLNSSFAGSFACLVVVTGSLSLSPALPSSTRARWLYAAAFALSCGVQLHLSLLSLLPPLLLLHLLRLRSAAALSRASYFGSVVFALLPLLPFLYGAWSSDAAAIEGGGTAGFSRYVFSVRDYWGASLSVDSRAAFRQLLFLLHRYLLDLGVLTVPAYGILLLWGGVCVGRGPRDGRAKELGCFCLGALMPALLGLGGGAHTSRYVAVFSVAYLLFVSAALGELLAAGPLRGLGASLSPARKCSLSFLLLAAWLLLAHPAARFRERFRAEPAFASFASVGELEPLIQRLRAASGWGYAEFRQRAFFVNLFNELSVAPFFESAVSTNAADPGYIGRGVFVARVLRSEERTEAEGRPADWLPKQRLPENLIRGIRSGAIQLDRPIAVPPLLAIPYRVLQPQRYPRFFQNRGIAYEEAEAPRAGSMARAEFVTCGLPRTGCDFSISAAALPEGRRLLVEVQGKALSLASNFLQPQWTEAIFDPFIEWSCRGGAVRREPLAPSVGFHMSTDWVLNHSFLAPYRREIELGCEAGSVKHLRLGYRESRVLVHLEERLLPGAAREFPGPFGIR